LLIYYFRKEEAEGHVSRKDKSDPKKKKKKVKSQTLCGFKNLLIVQYLRALPLQKKKHAINVVC
jgi:hypothetical protein